MSPDERLAEILTALEAVGVRCLVMGGHAVRFYGVERNTNDFDLHLSPACWDDLPERLRRSTLYAGRPPLEGPSWRPRTFRRFQVGVLPSAREEWLEFWKENHLLPPFDDLYARREVGMYGGRAIAFVALPDLIHTKETEREADWQDVGFLEEFLDARLFARAAAGSEELPAVLARIRSRRGFESHFQAGHLQGAGVVARALELTKLSIPQAFLLPRAPSVTNLPRVSAPIEPVVLKRLRTVPPGSPLHLTLVEAVRRQYKLAAQAADKADKEAIRVAQENASQARPGA